MFDELIDAGLLERDGERVRLTSRGRLLSNEVFARFIRDEHSARVCSADLCVTAERTHCN